VRASSFHLVSKSCICFSCSSTFLHGILLFGQRTCNCGP
jgi:hypothetical protein